MFLLFAIPCLIVRNTLMTTTLAIVYLAHVIGLSWYWRPKKRHSNLIKNKAKQEVCFFKSPVSVSILPYHSMIK